MKLLYLMVQMRSLKTFTTTRNFFIYSKMAQQASQTENKSRKIFEAAVESVQPLALLENMLERSPQSLLQVKGKKFSINHNIHVVGFGKAVLGMASAVEKIFGDHIVSGIVSVPIGIQSIQSEQLSKIQVFEGALNNLPDEKSLVAASKISEYVCSLDKSQLLLVLISGGGSALLPAPKPPLTLQGKLKVASMLAYKGATIQEINVVRKRLSTLKGGGLALLAKPAQVVGLIISDIIGDPLDLISSAPTARNRDDPMLPMSIIDKYLLRDQMPPEALQILENLPKDEAEEEDNNFNHVVNFIIGNNETALKAAACKAEDLGYEPIILTSKLQGMAQQTGSLLVKLASAFTSMNVDAIDRATTEIGLLTNVIEQLKHAMMCFESSDKRYCFLLGGETTVEVMGTGVGGRNQELALSAAIELTKVECENLVTLLSAGTDGIDGPTNAAGAIATGSVVPSAGEKGIDAMEHLSSNDSYTFYSLAGNGRWHIKTGHTGTNVMDIIIILIEK